MKMNELIIRLDNFKLCISRSPDPHPAGQLRPQTKQGGKMKPSVIDAAGFFSCAVTSKEEI